MNDEINNKEQKYLGNNARVEFGVIMIYKTMGFCKQEPMVLEACVKISIVLFLKNI